LEGNASHPDHRQIVATPRCLWLALRIAYRRSESEWTHPQTGLGSWCVHPGHRQGPAMLMPMANS